MYRTLSALLIALVLLVVTGFALWYFTYGLEQSAPARVGIPGLQAAASVSRTDAGQPVVTASGERDAYAALGYVHGVDRAWTAALWRQAALGRLAEWFGDRLLPVDRLMVQLQIARQARAAYQTLTDEEKALLDAYAGGLNAALSTRPVRLTEEFAALRLTPEPWTGWHSLAVERLFAWLAASPSEGLDPRALEHRDVRRLIEADSLLKDVLQLHHFDHSVAWVASDSTGPYLFQRHVYGSSALPPYEEVVMQWNGEGFMGASLIGAPLFPAGKTAHSAWALLPVSTLRLERSVVDTSAYSLRFERIVDKAGNEQLVRIRAADGSIQFAAPPGAPRAYTPPPVDSTLAGRPIPPDSLGFPPDSTWNLYWSGLQPLTDFPAWRALQQGEPLPFRLMNGVGIQLAADGAYRVLGSPEHVLNVEGGVLIGETRWAPYLATALDSLVRSGGPVQPLPERPGSFYSPWAAGLAPAMVASLDSLPNRRADIEEALTYLRNWNYAYDRSSIAGAVFDRWVARYADAVGSLPSAQVPDTLYFESSRRMLALQDVLASMREAYGPDLSEWRWERVNPDRRRFPVWSVDSLLNGAAVSLGRTRFAPLELPGEGHPTTLFWDSSPILRGREAPAAWEAWTGVSQWERLDVRRRPVDFSRFLARYSMSDRIPDPVSLSLSVPARPATTLYPLPSP